MAKLDPRLGILRNWYWVWLISGFFIAIMAVYFFTKYPAWLHFSYRGLSLSHEMNYAVWWSGICLFIAAIIFANVGSISYQQGKKTWAWYILALAMVALCFDEVGSLHEAVARVGGWQALLPFALVFAIAFGYVLVELVREKATRLIAFLIIISLSIFVFVAGLEFLEHDLSFLHLFYRRLRLVGEEAVELVAMGILISAGLIAMARVGDTDRRFLNATAIVSRIVEYPFVMFTILVAQIVVTTTFVVPNYTFFPEGNPAALFPVLLLFCLSILSLQVRQHSQHSNDKKFWLAQALIFLLASLLQMYNLNIFLNHLFGHPTAIAANIFTRAPISWMTAVIPFLTLGWYALRRKVTTKKSLVIYLLVLFFFLLLVFPELRQRYRIEYLYLMFSSIVAYSCYCLMLRLTPKE